MDRSSISEPVRVGRHGRVAFEIRGIVRQSESGSGPACVLLQDYEEKFTSLREAEGIGRPLGTADFVTELEHRLGRPIARRAPGRKAAAIPVGEQLNLLQ
jgi:hypothetical protein